MGKEDADKILSFLFKFRKGTYLMKKITKVIAAATALSAALGVCAYAAEDTIEDKYSWLSGWFTRKETVHREMNGYIGADRRLDI